MTTDPMAHDFDPGDLGPPLVPPKRQPETEIKDDGLQFLHETEASLWTSIYELMTNDKMFPELAADRAVKAYRMRVPLFTQSYVAETGTTGDGSSTG